MTENNIKRLFFGFTTHCPWPKAYPEGRIVEEKHRHLTLAFLGDTNFSGLEQHLSFFPKPPFKVCPVGVFNECLVLPPRHPRAMAWHVDFGPQTAVVLNYQHSIVEWLSVHGFFPAKADKPFTPHVTICRKPFSIKPWKKSFNPLPVMFNEIQLLESLGFSRYQNLWNYALVPAIELIEENIFLIRGESLSQLYRNAQMALAFEFPSFIQHIELSEVESLDALIIELNHLIKRIDRNKKCPIKAVSMHDSATDNDILEFQMLIKK